jgi:hypothetical protein
VIIMAGIVLPIMSVHVLPFVQSDFQA